MAPSAITSAPGKVGSKAAKNIANVKNKIDARIVFDGNQALYLGLKSNDNMMLYIIHDIVGISMKTYVAGYAKVLKFPKPASTDPLLMKVFMFEDTPTSRPNTITPIIAFSI